MPIDYSSEEVQQELIHKYRPYARQLFDEGKIYSPLVKALMEKGISKENAEAINQELLNQSNRQEREQAKRNMLIGGVLFIIGVIITFGTFFIAQGSPFGGFVIATGGMILGGGGMFVRGLMVFID